MTFLTTNFARILFGLPFIVFGVNHFVKADMMKGMIPSFLPAPLFWLYLTGVALILAGVSVIVKIQARLAMMLLALLLLSFVVFIHIPNLMGSLPNMLKDISLLAAALFIAGRVE